MSEVLLREDHSHGTEKRADRGRTRSSTGFDGGEERADRARMKSSTGSDKFSTGSAERARCNLFLTEGWLKAGLEGEPEWARASVAVARDVSRDGLVQ